MKETLILTSATWMVAALSVQSSVVIDTYPVSAFSGPLGEPDIATLGQTFTVPAGATHLDLFKITLSNLLSVPFRFYIAAWDGNKASVGMLYESSTFDNFGGGDFIVYPNITLTPKNKYVAFLSTSGLQDGKQCSAWIGVNIDNPHSYAGGEFVYIYSGNDFGRLTTYNWGIASYLESYLSLAFRAEFSTVPEPSTYFAGLSALGMLGLFGLRNRK